MRRIGVTDADIIDVPILYMPNEREPRFVDALTAGMVNMLVINRHCIVPKPFGPEVSGAPIVADQFEANLRAALTPLGLTLGFVDDWFYHVRLGEVHCGTNTLRRPTAFPRWWEFSR
jgi:protein-arginine deiminase